MTRIRFGRRKIAAASIGALVVAAAIFAWWKWGEVAGLTVLVLAVAGALLAVAWLLISLNRTSEKALKDVGRRIERIQAGLQDQALIWRQTEKLESDVRELRDHLRQPGEYVEQLLQTFHAATTRARMEEEALVQGFVEETRREVRREIDRLASGRKKDLLQTYRQIEALLGLYHELSPVTALPPTSGWAASPDLLAHLYRTIRERRPRLILECGSGVSTLIMAYALSKNGSGRLVTLEHLDEYRQQTAGWLASHSLSDIVDLRLVHLVPVKIEDREWLWYDPVSIPDETFDLVFIDGPPEATGEEARFPAMPLLHDRLSPQAVIVLDDAARKEESAIVERWIEMYPEWSASAIEHLKGTAQLERIS